MDNLKKYLHIVIAAIIIIVFKVIPPPEGMTQSGIFVIGVFLASLLLWMTDSIDWPSIMCMGLLGTIPEVGMKSVLQSSFGNETFAFLLFTFLCTYTLSQTPFLKRCAIGIVTNPLSSKGPWMFTISFFIAVIVIGCFMSPTVCFVVFLPILEEINEVLGLKKGDKIAAMLMIGLAFCVSVSSGMTPIAHVFSIMAMGFYNTATGLTISYADYMAMGIPVGILSVIVLLLVFKFIMKPDMSKLEHVDMISLKKSLTKAETKEKYVVAVFFLVIALWVFPEIFKGIFPAAAAAIKSYGTALPPVIGVVLYSIAKFDGKSPLSIKEATSKGVPWGSLIMAGGTLALGSALTNADVGLKEYLITTISPALGNISPAMLVLIFVSWACIQTNLSSNMVTVTVVTNIALPIVLATNGAVSAPAIACLVGLMGSFAFATPPSMPHIALASGSGWTDTSTVLKYGLLFCIITTIISVYIGYPIAAAIM